MSNYGPPPGAPQDPSGQPLPPTPPPTPAYGQPSAPPPPPASGYGAPAAPTGYGAAPAGYGYGAPTRPYASWGARVGAAIIDGLVAMVAMIPFWIGYGLLIGGAAAGGVSEYDPNTGMYTSAGEPNGALMAIGGLLMFIGFLVSLAFLYWNYGLKQGKTGYSIGKGVLGIKVVKEADGQVLGTWLSIGRFFVHYLDQLACYIGYLWPLWDDKRQTFADKILSTIVVVEPKK
ncbi:RDD family protein [Nocardioides sp. KC13]|uniref:RDD family protein n=1 Tax=Nocardioides turkmenicus TaxID=2711220 RepID=A0A6M1R0Q7_9ACTN|nr:RDD family protein [Nocardioides sp. KC13]NGN92231.1 RDD family protein [Nocardioides sp. KC13]